MGAFSAVSSFYGMVILAALIYLILSRMVAGWRFTDAGKWISSFFSQLKAWVNYLRLYGG